MQFIEGVALKTIKLLILLKIFVDENIKLINFIYQYIRQNIEPKICHCIKKKKKSSCFDFTKAQKIEKKKICESKWK